MPSCHGSSQWIIGYVDNKSGFGEEDDSDTGEEEERKWGCAQCRVQQRVRHDAWMKECVSARNSSWASVHMSSVLCDLWSDCTCENVACGRCVCLQMMHYLLVSSSQSQHWLPPQRTPRTGNPVETHDVLHPWASSWRQGTKKDTVILATKWVWDFASTSSAPSAPLPSTCWGSSRQRPSQTSAAQPFGRARSWPRCLPPGRNHLRSPFLAQLRRF